MQRRPQFLEPRWTLLRRDLLDSRGRVLESTFPWGHVSAGQCWPVRPVQTKHRRNGLGPGPGFAQAAFEAAPTGSSWDFPPFELRWRAGFPSPAPRRAGAAITMATAVSRPCAGGSRDILWRVLGWRIVSSIVWSVLLLPICTTVFIILSSIDLFHPIQWLSDSFNDLYSSYVIFYLLLLSVVIVIISIFNLEFYTVVPSVPCSRLALIGKILHPQQLVHSFIHAAMGMMMAWCAAVITRGRYSFLVVPCTGAESLENHSAQTCLNEYHLFFLLAGAFMGYSYSLLYFINNMNYLPFPIIQQYKFLRFRRSLLLLVKHSCVESLFLIRNFCIVYYFLGGHPHNWTAISRECLNLLNDMTQKLVLYQEAAATNGRVLSSSYPVEKETTFQTPTSNQMPRPSVPPLVRTSLFSSKLSTPDVASPLGSPFGSGVMNRMAGIFDVNTCYGSPQSPQLVRRGPRLWTSASDQQMTEFSNPPSTTVSAEGKTVRQPSGIYSWIQNKREQIKNFLSKRVLIMYFFSKHPEASIQAVFSDAQMHIWALEGLSHLVAASFTEDRFGVVQTTLPAILSTLLTLQEAVDKYFKLPHASSKPPRISGSLVDTSYKTLRFAFRASLKTAIYRITTTFGEHLNAVQASAEHQKRLQQFLEFKE
uniref:Nucleoporin NDC1 n=1 Tax=Equus caballus TaxID=9796 RepID=A0A9L0SJA4_HORSE